MEKRYEIEMKIKSKFAMENEVKKIMNFLVDCDKEVKSAPLWMTQDRSIILKIVKELKNNGWTKYDIEALELDYNKNFVKQRRSVEDNIMEEKNMISFTLKGLTPTNKLFMNAFCTIARSEDTYIVSIDWTHCFNKKGKEFSERELTSYKHNFDSNYITAHIWANQVREIQWKGDRIKNQK